LQGGGLVPAIRKKSVAWASGGKRTRVNEKENKKKKNKFAVLLSTIEPMEASQIKKGLLSSLGKA